MRWLWSSSGSSSEAARASVTRNVEPPAPLLTSTRLPPIASREAPADGQPEARATGAAGDLGLHLYERIEYDIPLVIGHAVARIDHVDDADPPVIAGMQTHASGRRELQSVGDEVGQDLLDPRGVADERPRQRALGGGAKIEAERLRPRPRLIDDFAQHAGEVKRLVLEWESAGLDPTEIEYVVGYVEKCPGRDAGDADAMSAFRRQGLIAKHVDRRHQAVQRRPDLVTHHGDEMPAGALRGVHEVVRPFQLFERGLVTGDDLRQLILPGAQGALALLYRASQAGHMVAYRVEPLPVQGEVPAQAAALMISGQYVPHGSHAHHADSRDGDVDSSTQKCRA